MKGFDDSPEKINSEIIAEQEKKKENRLIGKHRVIRGHVLWEYNVVTRELKKADIKKVDVRINTLDTSNIKGISVHGRVDIKENCTYFQSLNHKNAIKFLLKRGYKTL